MKINKNTDILIVGLGVIGGGYARALTNAGFKVNCITKEQKDIDFAIKNGFISYGTTELNEQLIKNAKLIIFALYPRTFIEWIENNQWLFSAGTIITDVAGVKTTVVNKIQNILRKDVEYVSCHPMAGREASGVEYSDANVFKGANYIVIKTDKNTENGLETCKELGKIIGFGKISELTAEEHDEMIAFLSQLTHCIAVTLMTCNETPHLEKYTGDSFRDLTRIAKINDKMWSELFLLNKTRLLKQMDDFIKEFNCLKEMIEKEDENAMRSVMQKAAKRRMLFDKAKE